MTHFVKIESAYGMFSQTSRGSGAHDIQRVKGAVAQLALSSFGEIDHLRFIFSCLMLTNVLAGYSKRSLNNS